MAEADILTKNYLSDKKRFADLFNVFAFDGRELIDADSLVDEDSSLTEKELLFQRQRDVLKSMSDGKQKLILLGIESQSSSHKSMPLRIMEYDALTYRRQLENKRKELIPVMTLVLFWGSDPWKGPRSLREMMGQESREMFEGLYQDYRIRIIAPFERKQEEISKLKSDLRLVFQAVKYSKDKEKFLDILYEDPGYRAVARTTAELIEVLTGSELVYNEEKEEIDMCEAIRQLMEEAQEKGLEKGFEKGAVQGELRGMFKAAVMMGRSEEEAYAFVSSACEKPVQEIKEIIKA